MRKERKWKRILSLLLVFAMVVCVDMPGGVRAAGDDAGSIQAPADPGAMDGAQEASAEHGMTDDAADRETLSGDTTTLYAADIAGGVSAGITWSIDAAGHLKVEGTGDFEEKEGASKIQRTPWYGNALEITSAAVNVSGMTNASYLFAYCQNMESVDLSGFDTSSVTNMEGMFYYCRALTDPDVGRFDTSAVTSMKSMFCGCDAMDSLNLSHFKTSLVTNMSNMFMGGGSSVQLKNINLSGFDTSSLTDMSYMFSGCSALESLDVSHFRTENVENMEGVFSACRGLSELRVDNFDTSKVTNMSYMFSGCNGLKEIDLHTFHTASVKNFAGMFFYCANLESLDLSGFDMTLAESAASIFTNCEKLQKIYAPTHLNVDAELPTGIWYKTDEQTLTLLPKELEESVAIEKNHVPKALAITVQKDRTLYDAGSVLDVDDLTVTYYDASGKSAVVKDFTTDAASVDMSAPGVKTLTVTYGELTASVEITVAYLLGEKQLAVTLSEEYFTYDGRDKKPVPTVVYKATGATLAEGTDYTVSYSDNVNAGTAKLILTGMGDCSGIYEHAFTIRKAASPKPVAKDVFADVCAEAATGRRTDISVPFADYGEITDWRIEECRENDAVAGNVLSGTPTVENGILIYDTNACTAGDSALIKLRLVFANYGDAEMSVTVTAAAAQKRKEAAILDLEDGGSRVRVRAKLVDGDVFVAYVQYRQGDSYKWQEVVFDDRIYQERNETVQYLQTAPDTDYEFRVIDSNENVLAIESLHTSAFPAKVRAGVMAESISDGSAKVIVNFEDYQGVFKNGETYLSAALLYKEASGRRYSAQGSVKLTKGSGETDGAVELTAYSLAADTLQTMELWVWEDVREDAYVTQAKSLRMEDITFTTAKSPLEGKLNFELEPGADGASFKYLVSLEEGNSAPDGINCAIYCCLKGSDFGEKLTQDTADAGDTFRLSEWNRYQSGGFLQSQYIYPGCEYVVRLVADSYVMEKTVRRQSKIFRRICGWTT